MTSLGQGTRVPKDNKRIMAIGDVDEANAAIGLVLLYTTDPMFNYVNHMLRIIQNDLFDVGADLAVPETSWQSERPRLRVTKEQVDRIEEAAEAINETLPPLTNFVMPRGSAAATYAHVARAVVRRAERSIVAMESNLGDIVNEYVIQYMNRLSDFLFIVARLANTKEEEVLWNPGMAEKDT